MKNFMSLVFFGSFFFLVGCCSSIVTQPKEKTLMSEHEKTRSAQVQSAKKIISLTVALMNTDPSNPEIHCSAIWIKRGMLLTANHCIDPGELIMYMTFDEINKNSFHLAVVKGYDEANDLALLLVDPSTEPPHEIVSITNEVIEPGEEVNIIGHTVGLGWTFSKGYVSSIRNNLRNSSDVVSEKVIQISSPAWLGNSGGGAFDSEGHLVGLCSYIFTTAPFLTYFVHKNTIVKFLEKEGVR